MLIHLACEMSTLDESAAVGARIRFYRSKRRMTSYTLAGLCGISRHAVMDYENGVTEPTLEDLRNIASTLGVDADKLYDDYYRFLAYPYSELVKKIRLENHLLQRELGEMLGVTRRAVERWEHGRNRVTREVWERFRKLGLWGNFR